MPVLDYAGGIVISRHRTAKDMPAEVLISCHIIFIYNNNSSKCNMDNIHSLLQNCDKEFKNRFVLQVLAEFQSAAQKFGVDWAKMCPSNNDHCPI